MLAAVFDPFHRPPEVLADGGQSDILAVDEPLQAEGPAHVAAQDAHAFHRMADHVGKVVPEPLGRLAGGVIGELARPRVVVGDRASSLHGHVGQAVLAERRLHDPVRFGEGALQVTVGAGDVVDDVVAHVVEQWRAGRVQSGGVGGDGGQRVIVNRDQLARVLGQAAAVGDDNGHQVSDQSHPVRRQGVELWLLHARQA